MLTGPACPRARCVPRMLLPALTPGACRAYIQGPLPPPSELHICPKLQDPSTPARCMPRMLMPAPAFGAYIYIYIYVCVRPAALIQCTTSMLTGPGPARPRTDVHHACSCLPPCPVRAAHIYNARCPHLAHCTYAYRTHPPPRPACAAHAYACSRARYVPRMRVPARVRYIPRIYMYIYMYTRPAAPT